MAIVQCGKGEYTKSTKRKRHDIDILVNRYTYIDVIQRVHKVFDMVGACNVCVFFRPSLFTD